MSKTLLELSEDIRDLEDALEICDDDEGRAIILGAYFETGYQTLHKIENYAGLIRELEYRAAGRKAESARLADLATTDANLAKSLKSRLLWWMQEHEQTKIETPNYRVSVQANGGVVPLLVTCEVGELPDRFWLVKTTIDPNKEALRKALESGEEITGVALGERGTRLVIK